MQNSSGNYWDYGFSDATTLKIAYNAGTKVTFLSSGKVGIGVTDPECELEIKGSSFGKKLFIDHSSSTDNDCYGMEIKYSAADPDDSSRYFINCNDSASQRFLVASDGTAYNHDNSYGQISDERIKTDIRDANSQWDDIKSLRVRNFKRKDDVAQYGDNAWEQIGVIAQEVEQGGMNKLVTHQPPTEFEINNLSIAEDDTVKGVKYSVLYMKAIKCLQEAMDKIETLEAKVEALENA
jgi:hypothetical protein